LKLDENEKLVLSSDNSPIRGLSYFDFRSLGRRKSDLKYNEARDEIITLQKYTDYESENEEMKLRRPIPLMMRRIPS